MPWKLKEPRMKNPRGGWRWTEFGKEVTANGPGDLAHRITNMRKANNVEVGDPHSDIARELAATDPWMVKYAPSGENAAQRNVDPFTKVVEQWTFEKLRTPAKFIHKLDARNRVDICLKCPHNQPIQHETEEESARYWRSLMIASRGECMITDGLRACAHHKHDNRLAAYIEDPHPAMRCCGEKDSPSHCWI